MILLVAAIAIGLSAGLLSGGSLRGLQAVRLRGESALVALLVVQLLIPSVSERLDVPRYLALGCWLLAMAGLVALALWNADAPGMVIAALGVALNLMVIGLNVGMPVSQRAAGIAAGSTEIVIAYDIVHRELTSSTLVPMLADIIPIPGPKGFRGVASIGDVMLVIGVGWFLYRATRDGAAP